MIIVIFLLPMISFAQEGGAICSKNGYTIEAINGIFTKEDGPNGLDGAAGNRKALKDHLRLPTYNNEPVNIDYLYNPTHGPFGLIDLTDVAIQKTNDSAYLLDPDFAKILNDASTQIKTQKVLVVAHSQGNFYANNLYKTVTRNGDMFEKSIGVYSVASPANYVAGNGIYRTSSTDTVINRARTALPGAVLSANDTINYSKSDDSGKGHAFREIYLEYRGEEIKKEIEESLSRLSISPFRTEDVVCISPPRALAISEKIINTAVYPISSALAGGASVFTYAKNTAGTLATGAQNLVTVAVRWTYDTTTTVAKFVGNTTLDLASATYNTVVEALTNKSITANSQAAVILATEKAPSVGISDPAKNQTATVNSSFNKQTIKQSPKTSSAGTPKNSEVIVFEPKVQNGTNAPKLVFVGSFAVGGQVMGSQSTASVAEEVVIVEEAIADNAGVALATPALSAPQCAQTLATDGCLLATTTVHFEWTAIEGTDHYLVNENGEYATTTENTFDVTVRDFSDYIFEVVAVGADGNPSATSTQKVSVATIPIAINEIAWMGTVASPSDEWFEIKNNTSHTIDLSQWELNAKDGTPHVKLTGVIAPKEYLIFERTDDTAVKDVIAHQTYTGELGNSGEQLNLLHASTTMDQTPDGTWVAGATSTRQTMERFSSRESGTDPSNWGTNLGYIKNGIDANGNEIEGTPGAQNSVSTLINKGQDITSDFTPTADEERYVITESGVWVHSSTTLTIEPGVEINFYNNGKIFVEGKLDAQGTPENPVIFRSFDDTTSGGIEFWYNNSTSTIDNAKIENTNGIEAYGEGTALNISNSEFSENAIALELYDGASTSISSSTITNTFDNDAIGVYYSDISISSTTIDGVSDGSGVAMYGGTLSIASSTIRNVSDSGISLAYATGTVSNVMIENAGYSGVDVYKSTVAIVGGEISGNTVGISMDEGSASFPVESVHGNGAFDENEVFIEENVVVW